MNNDLARLTIMNNLQFFSALFIILVSLPMTLFSKDFFPIVALMVWCPTWSKNLGRTLTCTLYNVCTLHATYQLKFSIFYILFPIKKIIDSSRCTFSVAWNASLLFGFQVAYYLTHWKIYWNQSCLNSMSLNGFNFSSIR